MDLKRLCTKNQRGSLIGAVKKLTFEKCSEQCPKFFAFIWSINDVRASGRGFASPGFCRNHFFHSPIERPYSRTAQTVGAVYDRPGFFVQSHLKRTAWTVVVVVMVLVLAAPRGLHAREEKTV